MDLSESLTQQHAPIINTATAAAACDDDDNNSNSTSIQTHIPASAIPSQAQEGNCTDVYKRRLEALERYCDEAAEWTAAAQANVDYLVHVQDVDAIPCASVSRILRDCATTSVQLDRLMVQLTRDYRHQLQAMRGALQAQLDKVRDQERQLLVQLQALDRSLIDEPHSNPLYETLLDRHCINAMSVRMFDSIAATQYATLARLQREKTTLYAEKNADEEESESCESSQSSDEKLTREGAMRREREE